MQSSAPEKPPQKSSPILFILLGGGLLVGIIMALLTISGGGGLIPGNVAVGEEAANLPTPIPDVIRVGQPAPDFTAQTPDGQTISLSDYRGSIVAINFWATWCAPCRVEMPTLQEAAEQFGDGQLVILAVNDAEPADVIQAFMEEFELTFPALVDRNEEIVYLYGIRVFPTTIWVDTEGIVRAEHFGPLSENQIEDYIDQMNHGEEAARP